MRASDLYPRLCSLRSLSLGLLRVCLSEALGVVCFLKFYCGTQCSGGVYPHPQRATVIYRISEALTYHNCNLNSYYKIMLWKSVNLEVKIIQMSRKQQ